MNTRGMQALALNRASSEFVTLIYTAYTDADDGSAIITNTSVQSPASVGILQAKDIERLEKAGIKVRNGVTIAIPRAQETPPDTIVNGDKTYRVVDWATANENGNISVIATCDEMTIFGADSV
jgi:hypothetical protein